MAQPRKTRPSITEKLLTGTKNQTKDVMLKIYTKIDNYIEPRHEISNNVVCATSKASDQPAHTRSLIRAFASCLNIL